MEHKINFLTIAITDSQELIRFIDNKTAVVITILGAYIVAFFTAIDKIVEYSASYSNCFWVLLIVFLILLILCIIVTCRIINPTDNPTDNIRFGVNKKPTLLFFLTPNKYPKFSFYPFRNSKKYKLEAKFQKYKDLIESSTDSYIIDSLTVELFKVNFIRNIKKDRFTFLLWLLLFTSCLFISAYLVFSIERHNISETLKDISQHCIKK